MILIVRIVFIYNNENNDPSSSSVPSSSSSLSTSQVLRFLGGYVLAITRSTTIGYPAIMALCWANGTPGTPYLRNSTFLREFRNLESTIVIEKWPFIVDFPIKNGDFP